MWTDEATESLRGLMAQGWTARKIAQHLGPAFTRSEVISKWRSMGLTYQVARTPATPITVSYSVLPFTSPATEPKPITFNDLENGMCRYPLSGEGRSIIFCGEKTINRTYCACHQKLTRIPGTASKLTVKDLLK